MKTSWTADLIDVAAVFFAVGTAHLFVTLLGERADGAFMLIASGAILVAGALLRRRRHRPAVVRPRHATLLDLLEIPGAASDLMRVRTTLPDRPGTLASLATGLAGRGVNILAIQIHPAERGAVDELLVAVPRSLSAAGLAEAVAAGGGEQTEIASADAHDLVDPATRALTIARHAATGATGLDEAMHRLLDAELSGALPSGVRHVAALHAAGGEPIFLARQFPAFTPTEISRAQSLIDFCEGALP
ncbi:MAG TPA: ACT domain-containing protein [Actinoplanes sp.]|jgi:hypothetical protein